MVDTMPMKDAFDRDRVLFKVSLPETPELPTESTTFTPQSHSQRSATLGWAQHKIWNATPEAKTVSHWLESSAAAHGSHEISCSTAQALAPSSVAQHHGVSDDALLDLFESDLLEEISKGSLATTLTSELTLPTPPVIVFKQEPPIVMAPSLPPFMSADAQDRAKEAWSQFRSIGAPVRHPPVLYGS